MISSGISLVNVLLSDCPLMMIDNTGEASVEREGVLQTIYVDEVETT